ncbi:rRNA-processing protein UTP23 homolog [Oppia nitens]|uniref:rRNA-processing protein UTP23 homolog n=1 Tax=Oppia nitens TaxID=1686743 RepID=UPI0023DA8FF0|nr:rRNA-processing protein UTP23 homolog [Oppia nitens]
MKVKRYKRVNKYLQFYMNSFGYRPPFQVVIDATFAQSCLKSKINIREQMTKYFGKHEIKLVTTVCVVQETQRLSQSLYGALLVIKQFPIHRCGHEKSPIAANDCIRELICGSGNNNPDHYMLATQDLQLTRSVRRSVVCPLIYLNGNVIVMTKPVDSVKEEAHRRGVDASDQLAEHDVQVLSKLKEIHGLADDSVGDNQPKKRRKGPKGPNPLSCKKPKTKPTTTTTTKTSGAGSSGSAGGGDGGTGSTDSRLRKRKRNRGRGGAASKTTHIKQMFDKIVANISTGGGGGGADTTN